MSPSRWARRPTRRAAPPPRRSRWWTAALAVIILAGVGAIVVSRNSAGSPGSPSSTASTTSSTTSEAGATGLASPGNLGGQPVDGIRCEAETVLFHVHAHLGIFIHDQPQVVPAGIGIVPPRTVEETAAGTVVTGGTCLYWLHSHTDDGVIHVESPIERAYTLGNYFDIWQQPLSATQIGPTTGTVTAFVDGTPFTGDPRTIPITAHALIQLNLDSSIGAQPFTFAEGL